MTPHNTHPRASRHPKRSPWAPQSPVHASSPQSGEKDRGAFLANGSLCKRVTLACFLQVVAHAYGSPCPLDAPFYSPANPCNSSLLLEPSSMGQCNLSLLHNP
eukprot:1156722-Pelagomonas_calceolata.AAC.7